MTTLSPDQMALMDDALDMLAQVPPALPSEPEFRVQHAGQRTAIDDLVQGHAWRRLGGYYVPTLAGLRACGTERARKIIRACNDLLDQLKEAVRRDPRKGRWTPAEIVQNSSMSVDEVKVSLTIVLESREHHLAGAWAHEPQSPFVLWVALVLDGVLDAQPIPETEAPVIVAEGQGSIKRLYIHNFRSFVNFEWELPPTCVLVGENGAGKTSLIEVLWLLQDIVVAGVPVDATIAHLARTAWLDELDQIIEIEVASGAELFRYRLIIRAEGGLGTVSEELHAADGLLYRSRSGKVESFGDRPSQMPKTTIPFDRKRSMIAVLEPRPDFQRIVAFREIIRRIWAMKPDPPRIIGVAQAESRFLARDLSNFSSWYLPRVAEDPEANATLLSDLRSAIRGFSSLRFVPISAEAKDLRATFLFGREKHDLGWTELSDGQRLLIALYGLLRLGLTQASLIALDEADNYIAPSEIQPWLQAAVDAASENQQQFLLISHNPEAINYVAADGAWRMWRDPVSGHTRIGPLEPDLEAGESAYEAAKSQVGTSTNGADHVHE